MPRGGSRPGSGRKPRGGSAARVRVTVWLAEEEAAEMTAALRDDETISQLLRDGGLRLVRARKG